MSDVEDTAQTIGSEKSRSRNRRRNMLGQGFLGLLVTAIISVVLQRWPIAWLSNEAPADRPQIQASRETPSPPASTPTAVTSATGIPGEPTLGPGSGGVIKGNTGVGAPVVTGPTTLTVLAALDDPLNGDPLNLTPVHNVRPLFVRVYTTNDVLVFDSQKGAAQTPGTDRYMAMFTLPASWTTGPYQVKIRMDFTLWQQVPGVPTITKGAANQLPVTAPIPGDVNQDNKVNIDDYDIITACYSDFEPAKGPCDNNQRRGADINDDMAVNAPDLNLYLRIMSARGGG